MDGSWLKTSNTLVAWIRKCICNVLNFKVQRKAVCQCLNALIKLFIPPIEVGETGSLRMSLYAFSRSVRPSLDSSSSISFISGSSTSCTVAKFSTLFVCTLNPYRPGFFFESVRAVFSVTVAAITVDSFLAFPLLTYLCDLDLTCVYAFLTYLFPSFFLFGFAVSYFSGCRTLRNSPSGRQV